MILSSTSLCVMGRIFIVDKENSIDKYKYKDEDKYENIEKNRKYKCPNIIKREARWFDSFYT